jgi:hypothetical protein
MIKTAAGYCAVMVENPPQRTYGPDRQPLPDPVTAPSGQILVEYDSGLPPRAFLDRVAADSPYGLLEVVVWLIEAASTGVLGNYSYDLLKKKIDSARKRDARMRADTEDFEPSRVGGDEALMRRPSGGPLVHPDRDLRDELVALASDAMVRNGHLTNHPSPTWSEIDVYLSENKTWIVSLREVGGNKHVDVEVDLSLPDSEFSIRFWL